MSNDKGSLVAERTLKTLLLFTEYKSLSLSEISKYLGISQTSTYRLVNTLHETGFIKRDESKRYMLDSLILKLASMIEPDIRTVSKPLIQDLANEIEESVYISSIFQNTEYIFIEKADSPFPLQWSISIGDTRQLHAGSPGKAHLAFASKEELNQILPNLTLNALTDTTIVELDQLKKELENIKMKGYSFSKGEHAKGVIGISVPILNAQKTRNIAVLSTFMAESRYNEKDLTQLVEALRKTSEKISSFIWE